MSAGLGLQDAAVALLVVGAVAWLTRRWWRRRKRGACTCDGCPVAERGAMPSSAPTLERPDTLVSIEGLEPRGR